MAKKIVRLTENDMTRLVKKVINEQENPTNMVNTTMDTLERTIQDRKVLANIHQFLLTQIKQGSREWNQGRKYYKIESYVPSLEDIQAMKLWSKFVN